MLTKIIIAVGLVLGAAQSSFALSRKTGYMLAGDIQSLQATVSANFQLISSTTLSDIPMSRSIDLDAGSTYYFEVVLLTTSSVSGGVQVAMDGTFSYQYLRFDTLVFDNSTIAAQSRTTALSAQAGAVTAVTNAQIVIRGTVLINQPGRLMVMFAQNSSQVPASTVLIGSKIQVWEID